MNNSRRNQQGGNMSTNGHGGARPGAGRPSTGHTKKSYTITLPLEIGLDLEKRAEQCNKKVHLYIRDLIIEAGHYNIEYFSSEHVDDSKSNEYGYSLLTINEDLYAADAVKPYNRHK